MTDTPGDDPNEQPNEPPSSPPPPPPPPGGPGYWEQQAAQQQQPQQPPYPPQQGYQQGYQQPYYGGQPQYYSPPDHPKATTAMIFGILAVVCCQVLGPFAWVIGGRAVREIDASHGQLGGRGQAMAGKILGIIGTVLMVLAVLYFVAIIAFAVSGAFDDDTDPFEDLQGATAQVAASS